MRPGYKIFRLIITILIANAVIVVITFLSCSYTQLNDKGIPEQALYNGLYVTRDNAVTLLIGEDLGTVRMNITDVVLAGSYEENILKFRGGGKEYTFIVIDGSTLYGDVAGYMYKVEQ